MEHGKVTTVRYEDGVVLCNVSPVRPGKEYKQVPIMKPHESFIQMPNQGDTVTMEQLSDGTRFVSNIISKRSETPDAMREGELSIYMGEDTQVTFSSNTDGTWDLDISASNDVNITANGDVNIEAGGSVNTSP